MEKYEITNGVYWVHIPEVDLRILCGCPADVVKHCMKRGFIIPREKDDVTFETGPNAILLSDISVQNGYFSNLAEFPVLQMFYRQGMLIPGHPNNTGEKPLLIGLEDQVTSQMNYIYRGNYGLVSKEEIMEAGIPEAEAEEMMRLKLRFAYDNIRTLEELLEPKIIDREIVELASGVYIHRTGLNRYTFIYGDETVSVNLNLGKHDGYHPPYNLGFHQAKRHYFSILHVGEGDGWDIGRPCMGSILQFQGKVYLVDAGPGIMDTLVSLGICIDEIEGIFHTHAHDDHFAGLPSLIRGGHRLAYFATPLVRHSVTKKISALLSMEEERFGDFFEIHDLEFDTWNDIEGLEVKPVFSPHPVETSIMFFRTYWEGGIKSYAHLADIAAFDVLEGMITVDPQKSGITREKFETVKKQYHEPASIKKIDIGGGYIHGKAVDFEDDTSPRLLLSHTSRDLSMAEKEIGSNATFGMQDVLIKGQQDYSMSDAFHHLESYFPMVSKEGLKVLTNFAVIAVNVGTILFKQGEPIDHIFLVVNGVVSVIDSKKEIDTVISPGHLIGEIGGIIGEKAPATYRAASYIRVVKIPVDVYRWFVKKFDLFDEIKRMSQNRNFFRETWLLGESIPSNVQNRLAQVTETVVWEKGEEITAPGGEKLLIIKSGCGSLYSHQHMTVDRLERTDFFGEDAAITGTAGMFTFRPAETVEAVVIPAKEIKEVPVVLWKLFETFERRIKLFKTHFDICWYDTYKIGIADIDGEHKQLFEQLSDIYAAKKENGFTKRYAEKLDHYIESLKQHLRHEETLMSEYDYSRITVQQNAHAVVIEMIAAFNGKKKHTIDEQNKFLEELKEWLLYHTLIEDRKYSQFFQEHGV
jgi:hemerythrin